jgi:hypothetical protein
MRGARLFYAAAPFSAIFFFAVSVRSSFMRYFIASLLVFIVAGFAAVAGAQTYPSKAVRLIVPFPPGAVASSVKHWGSN